MHVRPAQTDLDFRDAFEDLRVSTSDFSHRNHLRLAFVYLCEGGVDQAHDRMKTALLVFLAHNNVPPEKYHETLTRSWTQAVHHFMHSAPAGTGFDAFIDADDRLLDTGIMLSHYSKDRLFSDAARRNFVAPDLDPIPQHP